jgi:hypothetical protein
MEGAIQTRRLSVRTARAATACEALILLIAGASPGTAQPSADPFTPSERWSLYVHRTYGPDRLGFLAVDTAIDQALRDPGRWNGGADSYGLRYARALQGRIVRNSAELVTGLLTGEDLRYHPSLSHSVGGRLWNALRSSVTAQMPDGTRRPAYTRFFANELASVSTARWDGRPIQPERLMRSLTFSIVDQAQTNILTEFGPDFRRIGIHIWKANVYPILALADVFRGNALGVFKPGRTRLTRRGVSSSGRLAGSSPLAK